MAFTATINTITPTADGTGTGATYSTLVTFADSATGYTSSKTYNFPVNTTQASAVATITADGAAIKAILATAGNLQGKVGSVIVI